MIAKAITNLGGMALDHIDLALEEIEELLDELEKSSGTFEERLTDLNYIRCYLRKVEQEVTATSISNAQYKVYTGLWDRARALAVVLDTSVSGKKQQEAVVA